MVRFFIAFPHHEAMMTSGLASRTASADDDAILRERCAASCGKIGSPPAISISSSTQQMPEMSGSSHSSKNTRGRRRRCAARSRMPSSPRARSSASGFSRRLPSDKRTDGPDHPQYFRDRSLVEDDHVVAAPNQLRGDVRLKIGKAQDQIRLQRLDLVESRVDERGDLGLASRFGRPHGVARDSHHAVAFPE